MKTKYLLIYISSVVIALNLFYFISKQMLNYKAEKHYNDTQILNNFISQVDNLQKEEHQQLDRILNKNIENQEYIIKHNKINRSFLNLLTIINNIYTSMILLIFLIYLIGFYFGKKQNFKNN